MSKKSWKNDTNARKHAGLSTSMRIAGWVACVLIAVVNARYLTSDIKYAIRKFTAIYDPLPNVLHERLNLFFNSSKLETCHFVSSDSNDCTLSNYEYHLPWAVRFYQRFAFENDEAIRRRFYLYLHIGCNTIGLLLCTLIQFNSYFQRKNNIKYHRYCGRISIILIYFGTICSCILASDMRQETEYGGLWGQYGFYFLGLTLFVPFGIAFYFIRVKKNKILHQLWMIRANGALWGSFAVFRMMELVFSPILQNFVSLSINLDIWFSGLIGLAIAEYYVRKYRKDLLVCITKSHTS